MDHGRAVVEGEAMLALGAQLRYRTGGEGRREEEQKKREELSICLAMVAGHFMQQALELVWSHTHSLTSQI